MTPDRSGPTPVVDAVARNRPVVGAVLLVLALAALGGAVYFGARAVSARPVPVPEATADSPAPTPEVNPDALRQPEFILAALSLGMIAVSLGAPGIQGLAAVQKPTLEGQRHDARRLILIGGGLFGIVLMFAGLVFFAYHFGTLVRWLSSATPPADAYKPVVALLAFVLGAGVAFLSVQPTRADERTDENSRRLVFGANVVLTSLLLLAALVVLNIAIGLKVPNRIDTTAAGLNSHDLAPQTQEFLRGLDQPVKFYTTVPEAADESVRPVAENLRRMLNAVRDANPKLIAVEYLSPLVNAERIAALRAKFPEARDFADFGILVTVGADEKQYGSIPQPDLFSRQTRGGPPQFVGEGRVLKELLFLADNKVKPAVYFTTGHGELDVLDAPPGGDAGARRPASGLRTVLTDANVDAKPLAFDIAKPAVPPDATVVVVADPRAALQPAEVEALRAYLSGPRPDGKKGKLIILSGPSSGPGGAGVVDVGLDPLLAEYGLSLDNRYLLAAPVSNIPATDQVVVATQSAADAKVTFADTLGENAALFPRSRVVRTGSPADQAVRVVPALITAQGRATWFQPDLLTDPAKTYADMRGGNQALMQQTQVSAGAPRVVAAAAVEGEVGRVVVFGSGEAFRDRTRGAGASPNAALFGAAVNYLRDRPAVRDIAAKTHDVYRMPTEPDWAKGVVLPAVIGALSTVALGVGVFMIRRR